MATEKMKLPIGYDDFGKVIDQDLQFVDKSLFIQDVIEDPAEVILITRPRRFGKTFNLSLLHYFFAEYVRGIKTQGLFDTLKIAQYPNYMQYQGKYPVINITFKDIKNDSIGEAYKDLGNLMSNVYSEYRYLLDSPKLYAEDKCFIKTVLCQKTNEVFLKASLKNLTRYLSLHHGVHPWLFIDEYDTLIQTGYLHGYYDQAVALIRNLLSAALKNNPYLQKAVLTGVLRVAKESLFSGLNNIKVYSLLSNRYASHFGFTEEEVDSLCGKAGLAYLREGIRTWYNGYQFDSMVIYNPWSVVNCLNEGGVLQPYWVNTNDNFLMQRLLTQSDLAIKAKFQQLLAGNLVEATIDDNVVFSQLEKNDAALWSLFVMAGYLKITAIELNPEGLFTCQLQIPNQEVRSLYVRFIKEWLAKGRSSDWYNQFLAHLLTGQIDQFEEVLKQILLQTTSIHDMAHEPEAFYQGLMLGLIASLRQEDYTVKSNRESGYGRYDIAIIPQKSNALAILLELKSIHIPVYKRLYEVSREKFLLSTAQEALAQIHQRHYLADLEHQGIRRVCKIGVAFSGKYLKVCYEIGE